ncbi:MAG: Ig-like domain-containing protein [Gammaproteobacteria bacterium]
MHNRSLRISGVALALASLLALTGCGGGGLYGGGGGGSGPVATITIAPATATIAVNGTQQYTAVAKDASGNTVNGVTYTWNSSSPAMATINANGLATGMAAGSSMITASVTYTGGIYGMGVTITSNAATLTVTASAMAMGTVAISSSISSPMMNGMMMGGVTGRAVQGAVVSLKDSGSQTVVAMTDTSGRFQIATSGLNGGFLLQAADNQGHVLYSFAAGAGVINVTSLTDLMVRMWYQAHGTTAEAAFADPAAHPVPQASELATLNSALTGLLAGALTSQGLDPAKFNMIATPFVASGGGFGAVLDHVAVSPANGGFLLRDTLGQRETTITFDAAHHAVALNTVDLTGQTAASRTSLVLP